MAKQDEQNLMALIREIVEMQALLVKHQKGFLKSVPNDLEEKLAFVESRLATLEKGMNRGGGGK